jgi:hypothetical protein
VLEVVGDGKENEERHACGEGESILERVKKFL